MSQQRTVSVQTNSEAEEEVEEKKQTSAFFFEYVSRRADCDQDLSVNEAGIIQQQKEQAVEAVNDEGAIKVASRLADLGELSG